MMLTALSVRGWRDSLSYLRDLTWDSRYDRAAYVPVKRRSFSARGSVLSVAMPDCNPARAQSAGVEPLEARSLLNGDGPEVVTVQSSPPAIAVDVYADGTAWAQPFRDYVQNVGLGLAAYGHRVGELSQFPWTNLDRVTVRFSADVLVKPSDLKVRGVTVASYPVASVDYRFDPYFGLGIATFRLAGAGLSRPDRLLFEVDGGPGGVTERHGPALDGDGDGQPGGDYFFRLRVLPGGASLASSVQVQDWRATRARLGLSTANRGRAPYLYYHGADINGSGRIDVLDLAEVRHRMFSRLPDNAPSIASTNDTPFTTRTRPVTRGLFSSEPILS